MCRDNWGTQVMDQKKKSFSLITAAAVALVLSGCTIPADESLEECEPGVSEIGAPELARRLKIVLDQKLWIEPEKLSDEVEGHVEDGLSPDVDQVGAIALPSGLVQIFWMASGSR